MGKMKTRLWLLGGSGSMSAALASPPISPIAARHLDLRPVTAVVGREGLWIIQKVR
jgi:hypothetical protein